MSRLTRAWARLFALWPKATPPPIHRRPRRRRARCEGCGQDIAVIASTGQLWHHRCVRPGRDEAAS